MLNIPIRPRSRCLCDISVGQIVWMKNGGTLEISVPFEGELWRGRHLGAEQAHSQG
jgi:hypothetical protein